MPSKTLYHMADKMGKSRKDAERYWRFGKRQAKKRGFEEDSDEYWAYVMGIVKRRMGYESALRIERILSRLEAYDV